MHGISLPTLSVVHDGPGTGCYSMAFPMPWTARPELRVTFTLLAGLARTSWPVSRTKFVPSHDQWVRVRKLPDQRRSLPTFVDACCRIPSWCAPSVPHRRSIGKRQVVNEHCWIRSNSGVCASVSLPRPRSRGSSLNSVCAPDLELEPSDQKPALHAVDHGAQQPTTICHSRPGGSRRQGGVGHCRRTVGVRKSLAMDRFSDRPDS